MNLAGLIRKIRVARRASIIEIIAFVFGMVSLGLGIQSSISLGICLFTVSLYIAALLCVVTIIVCSRSLNSALHAESQMYILPVCAQTDREIIQRLRAENVQDDTYFYFGRYHQFRVRILISRVHAFLQKDVMKDRKKANAQCNKKFGITQEGELCEVLNSFRIDLIICDEKSDELINWIKKNTQQLISRNESIFRAAVCLDSSELMIAAGFRNISVVEVEKYCAAIELLGKIAG